MKASRPDRVFVDVDVVFGMKLYLLARYPQNFCTCKEPINAEHSLRVQREKGARVPRLVMCLRSQIRLDFVCINYYSALEVMESQRREYWS